MGSPMAACAGAVLAALLTEGPGEVTMAGKAGALATALARADEAWKVRDQPGKLDEVASLLAEAEKVAPDAYDVLWRRAQLEFWRSDDPTLPDTEKSRIGKLAWDYGDKASAADPGRVEGWFFAAAGIGNYALGIGVLKALGQGVEGKFKERLSRAERIDPRFFSGGIFVAWGRFWFKLPWPKYDPKKSETALRRALQVNPESVRGRVFLAELYEKEDDPKEARRLLEEAIGLKPGAYDAPEERRAQGLARELLAGMKK